MVFVFFRTLKYNNNFHVFIFYGFKEWSQLYIDDLYGHKAPVGLFFQLFYFVLFKKKN
jgi:hypothetical protein